MPQVHGEYEKETKRMIRYATDWGIIYIPKTAFNGEPPEEIMVTVTALDE